MENPTAFQTHYIERQRQMAWINDTDWQFERPVRENRTRAAIAKALIALATRLAPTAHTIPLTSDF